MKDFTNGIKVGDIITAYHNGYHIVVSVNRRYEDGYCLPKGKKIGDEMNALIEYRTVMNAKLKPVNSKTTKSSDSAYCQVVTIRTVKGEKRSEIDRISEGYDALLRIVKTA